MKNHTNKIYKTYVNRLLSTAPDTKIEPANEKEPQDQKVAELNSSVWTFTKRQTKFSELRRQFAEDYVGIGEVWARISWDWDKGYLKREEDIMETVTDETGATFERPSGKKKSIFSGALCIDRVFGFNVFRPKGCQDLSKAPWLGIRYMGDVKDLQEEYSDKKEKIKADSQTSFLVFDQNSGDYTTSKDQVLVKEVYYRPSPKYPRGYYYKFIHSDILAEGELPGGIFPLVHTGFDAIPTHPRFNAPVKQWKPYQVEINRMASKMAEHQITLGDDKVIMQNGGKLSAGGNHPGIRGLSATGGNISVIPGRTGEQYMPVLNDTIADFYRAAMVPDEAEADSTTGQVDPYALLLASSKWKTRFSTHIERFQSFLTELTELCIKVTKEYIEEDEVIQIVGRHERVNIAEYKNSDPLAFQIKFAEGSDDVESRVGKKLSIDRYLQYAGSNLSKEDIGKFIRIDPYLNTEQMFSDFTLAYDNAQNDILMLDRGQMPPMNRYRYPDIGYILQKLSHRMGQADFLYLPDQVKALYEQALAQYQQMMTQMVQEQAALNADMIPTDGPLIRTDMWVPSLKDPTKQERMALPNSTLLWIWDRLQKQGMTMDVLQAQQQAVVANVAQQMRGNVAQQQPQANGQQLPAYMQRFLGMLNTAGQP